MQHRPSSTGTDNDGRYPDESDVLTPYPLTPEQGSGDRAGWPWLPGWIVSQCGPDEWEICVQEPALARLDDGAVPPPGTPGEGVQLPGVLQGRIRGSGQVTVPRPGNGS